MKFFTEIKIPESPDKIDYSTKITMMGSCFAENIGDKLSRLKFNIDLNPFGILYNPVSVANSLEILAGRKLFTPSDLFFSEGAWHSFSHHGKFASADREKALDQINSRIIAGSANLKNAGFLFLTFGTAWVYELIETGQVVSNCHKIPAAKFRRYRLGAMEIAEKMGALLQKLHEINPGLKVVFTVSPIRHWKDGAVENQVSKATLILAVSHIVENCPWCSYFPSYEIVMDELRDYRFYSDDMLHLSGAAINHIWAKFKETYFNNDARKISDEVAKLVDAASHRPFFPGSPEFRKFVSLCLKQAETLLLKYPFLDLTQEIGYFKEQIDNLSV